MSEILVPTVGINTVSREEFNRSVQGTINSFDALLSTLTPIVFFEKALNIHKLHLTGALLTFIIVVILIASGVQAGLLTDLVGYCYPAYMSLCSVGRVGKEIEALWLGYWSIFGFFTIIEHFEDIVLKMFPFYYIFKLVTILWLVSPYTQGAILIYELILRHLTPLCDFTFAILLPTPSPTTTATPTPGETVAAAAAAAVVEKKIEATTGESGGRLFGFWGGSAPRVQVVQGSSDLVRGRVGGMAGVRGDMRGDVRGLGGKTGVKWGYVRV